MKAIKCVIHERARAWIEAQELWQLRLKGVDIWDKEIQEKMESMKTEKKNLQKRLKSKRRLSPLQAERARLYFGDNVQLHRGLDAFKLTPTKSTSKYDIDMTPKVNRQHYGRRRREKFRRAQI
jgi:hypothetical protein